MSCLDRCPSCGQCMEEGDADNLECYSCGHIEAIPMGRHGRIEDEEEQAHERFTRWRESEAI